MDYFGDYYDDMPVFYYAAYDRREKCYYISSCILDSYFMTGDYMLYDSIEECIAGNGLIDIGGGKYAER